METIWIVLAFASAAFAGLTSILAKVGIANVNSHVATALRTSVVAIFAWAFAASLGDLTNLLTLSKETYVFLILSGLATGASWIMFMFALKLLPASKVVPIDKFSTIIAMLISIIFLQGGQIDEAMVIAIVGITMGTGLMIGIPSKELEKDVRNLPQPEFENMSLEEKGKNVRGYVYAILSAVFAGVSIVLAKYGLEDVNSRLGTAITTGVVVIMAWAMVGINGKSVSFKMDRKSALFLILSGLTTGLSWVCYYAAIKFGVPSVVIPIDKLSGVITVIFAWTFLKEKPTTSAGLGLILITAGTLMLVIGQYI